MNTPNKTGENLTANLQPADLLTSLWELGKTSAKLSATGVQMQIDGREYTVKHNRRSSNAYLRLYPVGDTSNRIYIELSNAYLPTETPSKRNMAEGIKVNPGVTVTRELRGSVDEQGDFIVELTGGESAQDIHCILGFIAEIGDIKNGVKRFRIDWPGDLVRLLPYSLLHKFYDMVRVAPEGGLIVNNYREIAKEEKNVEAYERQTGIGLQKAINLREGMLMEEDGEDIEVLITDFDIRGYIRSVIEKTGLSPHHPLFREMYDFYFNIVLQVKLTRDNLRHLLPVRPNEPLRIRIGSDEMDGHAYYSPNSANRGNKQYLRLEETHHHSTMAYPPNRYNAFDPEKPAALEIKPGALQAETRHHVHQMRLDQLDRNNLPGGLAFSGIQETVDDMQYFGEHYRYQRKSLQDTGMHGLMREIDRDGYRDEWELMTIIDKEFPAGVTGHIFTPHVIRSLAKKFASRKRPLTGQEMEMIDRAVFEFLSAVEIEQTASMRFLVTKLRLVKTILGMGAPEDLIGKKMASLCQDMGLPDDSGLDMEYLGKVMEKYEKYKGEVEQIIAAIRKLEGDRNQYPDIHERLKEKFKLHVRIGKCLADKEILEEFMKKYIPFHAPDGKDYPSISSYFLDPEVIYEKILARYPQLAE